MRGRLIIVRQEWRKAACDNGNSNSHDPESGQGESVVKPKEIYPSSYKCECGHVSDFFENTIIEIKAMSMKRKVYLGDSAQNEHTIVFHMGEAVDMICPNEGNTGQAMDAKKAPPPRQKR